MSSKTTKFKREREMSYSRDEFGSCVLHDHFIPGMNLGAEYSMITLL